MGPLLTIREILDATRGVLLRGGGPGTVKGVSTDTRTLRPGSLFVALRGDRFDGHRFLAAAAEAGAAAMVVREAPPEDRLSGLTGVDVIRVEDTLTALGDLAGHVRRRFRVPVIAITGSSGKTTTKEMAAAVIGRKMETLKTEGNLNNLIGVPLMLFRLEAGHQAAILELGTNRPGEIARLTRIARPDVGLVTNIGPAHLEGLGSLDGVCREKGDLFRNMSETATALINRDDPYVRALEVRWPGKKVTYGVEREADITGTDIRVDREGTSFRLGMGGGLQDVRIALCGRHAVSNALAAAACARALGLDDTAVREGLESFRPVSGRMTVLPLANGAFLIDDAYNANPASVREALRTLRDLRGAGAGVAILGDMLELGGSSAELHRETGRLLAETGIRRAYLKGAFSGDTARGAVEGGLAPGDVSFFEDPAEILPSLQEILRSGDWVLVKGSRRMRLEEAVRAIGGLFGTKEIA
ncbi:MAG: UDP-N-acetylmuramoyl-tripeptide--D-alanyl-D-alanine ligase [Syntrophaceae bacterium]|nr:UDP-N-acetylmuramoyl-tripeptide--D-alanyl-D-alanine ligase [Syntrophaceae bacterium]